MTETYRDKLYPLSERMIQTAVEIISQCKLVVTNRGITDPKLLALALLSRTLANFKGVIVLVKGGFRQRRVSEDRHDHLRSCA